MWKMPELTFYPPTCFFCFFYLLEIAFGSPVDFPFLEHSCGRMMHSLWATDCYSCRYTVPLRKGEPTDDIMQLHGRLSGWVRWMWADWKSQCSLCLGTKSSCGEDISYSVSIKTWVTRRKIKCTFNSSSTDNPTRVASSHLQTFPYQNIAASEPQLGKKKLFPELKCKS